MTFFLLLTRIYYEHRQIPRVFDLPSKILPHGKLQVNLYFRSLICIFADELRTHTHTMKLVKRLDAFTMKAFLQLMAATFVVCLFVFLMQYTWRWIDELIGKGLSMTVLAKFFWYAGLSFVPAALPPGILLASLITFGNMGEKLELLAMKA